MGLEMTVTQLVHSEADKIDIGKGIYIALLSIPLLIGFIASMIVVAIRLSVGAVIVGYQFGMKSFGTVNGHSRKNP